MDFCFIMPTPFLSRFGTISRAQLVLPQIRDPDYVKFFTTRQMRGDTLILDNGAYEGVKDWAHLEWGLDTYKPKHAVLPDLYLHAAQENFEQAVRWWEQNKNRWNVKWAWCPQAVPGDIKGFKRYMYKGIEKFKPSLVMLPRNLATHVWPENPNIRAQLCEDLTDQGQKVHALGMINGNLKELEELAFSRCGSCDSAAPIYRGTFNLLLTDPGDLRAWNTCGTAVDFSYPFENQPWQLPAIQHNCNAVMSAIGRKLIWNKPLPLVRSSN